MSAPRDALLPSNATAWETAQSQTSARILDTDTDMVRRARDPVRAPAALLPWLAAERSLHRYAPGDEAGNRARISASFGDHLGYGSPAALEAEIAGDAGLRVRLVEAHERARLEWPDFLVEVLVDPGDPAPDVTRVEASALRRKNVRDDLAQVRVVANQPAGALYVGAATHVSPRIRILPGDVKPDPQLRIGAAIRVLPRVKILPRAA